MGRHVLTFDENRDVVEVFVTARSKLARREIVYLWTNDVDCWGAHCNAKAPLLPAIGKDGSLEPDAVHVKPVSVVKLGSSPSAPSI